MTGSPGSADARSTAGGRLFRKYVAAFIAVIAVALTVNGFFQIWLSYQEQKRLHKAEWKAMSASA